MYIEVYTTSLVRVAGVSNMRKLCVRNVESNVRMMLWNDY